MKWGSCVQCKRMGEHSNLASQKKDRPFRARSNYVTWGGKVQKKRRKYGNQNRGTADRQAPK